MCLKNITLFLFLFLYNIDSNAQIGNPFITNYTSKDYNAGYQNWAVVQDNCGIIYVGNSNKILIYDGVSWDLVSLPKSTVVRSLSVDLNGKIYAGGQGNFGYLTYSTKNGNPQFESFLNYIPEDTRSFDDVWQIACNGNNVYFQTSKYIFCWDHKKITVLRPETSFHLLLKYGNKLIVRQRNLGLYEVTGNDLVKLSYGNVFKQIPLFAIKQEDSNFTFYSMFDGAFKLYNDTLLLEQNSFLNEYFKNNHLYCGVSLKNNSYAFGTIKGGMIIEKHQTGKYLQVNNEYGLLNNSVSYLYEDNQAGLWSALEKGVARTEINSPISIFNSYNGVNSFVKDLISYNDKIYIIYPNGISFVDISDKKPLNKNLFFKPFEEITGNCNMVINFSSLKYNSILLSNTFGIYEIHSDNAPVQIYKSIESITTIMQSKTNVNQVYFTNSNNLFLMELINGKWSKCEILAGFDNFIHNISQDNKGNLWLSTQQGSVYFVEKHAFQKKEIYNSVKFDQSHGLPNASIFVYNINNQIKLVSGTGGIYKPVPDRKKMYKFVIDTTFLRDIVHLNGNYKKFTINPIIEDKKGNIWMVVNMKIQVAKPFFDSTHKVVQYRIDTIPFKRIPQMNILSIYPEENGIIWFSGGDGIIRYDSNVKFDYKVDFPVLIRKVTIGKDSVIFQGNYYDSIGVSSLTQPEKLKIKIPYEFQSTTFEYAAPSFDNEKANMFRYNLIGYDNGWSKWSHEHKKEYTNLSEGNYIFTVEAKNIYEHISKQATFEFSILPPWYRHPAAMIGYLVLFIAAFIGSIRLYTMRLRAQKKRLEQIVKDRTKEIQEKNIQLESTNIVIAQKNKDITDSINYARRIQLAIMEEKEVIYKQIPNSFILYMPRDIVSGDFYYYNKLNDDETILAVCDCTGHGVPGAFMSMIGNDQLNYAIIERKITTPSKILDQLHEGIRFALHQNKETSMVRDGMDLSLCKINLKKKEVEYAGAHRPLWILRNGKELSNNTHSESTDTSVLLDEIKADKFPIGGYQSEENRIFTNKTINLKPGDTIYMFTDGYLDQFGGPKKKKLTTKRFREKIMEIQQLPIHEQEKTLSEYFYEWKGEDEQIDDVMVIGIKF